MPALDRLTRPARHLRRAVLARRRLLAALLAGTAAAVGVHSATAQPPPAVTVLAAARDLPAGTLLAADDLTPVPLPPAGVPDGVADDPVGRLLASPLRRGEPVTDVRLVGPALTGAEATRVAVPVRLSDAAAVTLLRPGDVVDLHATDPQRGGATTVARAVPVLAVPPAGADAASGQPGALVVVGLDPAEVPSLVDAGVRLFLSFSFAR